MVSISSVVIFSLLMMVAIEQIGCERVRLCGTLLVNLIENHCEDKGGIYVPNKRTVQADIDSGKFE